jgi:hypothetical protein
MMVSMLIPQDCIVEKKVQVRPTAWYSPPEHTRNIKMLSEEMRAWFKENRLKRGSSYRVSIPWLYFENEEDAILFKLRWH